MDKKIVNILGTEYCICKKKYNEESAFKDRKIDGYCDGYLHLIVYCDLDSDERWDNEPAETKRQCEKSTIRHEIIHAFLNESGLQDSTYAVDMAWAKNEEMVDWLAIQSPKIFAVYKELNIL